MLWGSLWFLVALELFLFSWKRHFWLPKPVPWWYILFFFSGFPALIYQIVWQRALFAIYGVNIESVTIVVTAFMLGLGLGSLLGGMLSAKRGLPLLAIFGVVELCIGAWGAVSLNIFHWAALFTAGVPPLETGLLSFGLVVVPTILMGSTLPILVAHTVRVSGNVGTSVGALYAVNTLGSAAACFCAGMFIMRLLGESGSVALAALINASVGGLVLLWHLRTREAGAKTARPAGATGAAGGAAGAQSVAGDPAVELPSVPQAQSEPAARLNFYVAMVIVGMAGFISLAYEIVWYRLFSFTTGGLAKSFAYLLGAYLAGIGIGCLVNESAYKTVPGRKRHFRQVTAFVFAANILGFLVAPVLGNLVRYASLYWTLLPIGLAAAFLGAVFPLICHLSIPPDERSGARTSYLYLSNIIGSALGSFVVGFVLMDVLSIRQIAMVIALAGVALGTGLVFQARLESKQLLGALAASLAMAAFIFFSSNTLFDSIYEKMLLKWEYERGARFAHVVENKSGVITVTRGGIVLGGGVYDGRFNVDLINDVNSIQRPFAISYFHPDPKEVLVVGLASGSWAQILANHPQVEHMIVVEINPGFLQLIPQYVEVASLLKNPKVEIITDDGRRWLVRNPERKFDVIMMNTSFHWRSHASNILSVDFLQLIRRHLKPGGVDFYNTTDSVEAQAAGVRVFPYALRVGNCLAVSDSPLQLDRERWREILTRYSIDGKPVFDLTREHDRARLAEILSMTETVDLPSFSLYTLESYAHLRERTKYARAITDDNMGTEWMY